MPQPRESIGNLQRVRDVGAGRELPFPWDKNERLIPFSPGLISLLQEKFNSDWLTKYPDQSGLYETLSNYVSVDPSQILLVNGSDSGIKTVFEALLEPGATVCTLDPTYAMFNVYAKMFGCDVRKLVFDERLDVSVEDILCSIREDVSLLYLANPNQPTGTFINSSDIEVIVEHACEHDVFVLIDEAYIEFSGESGSLRMIERYSNLGVLRTFSKAWGLAGLRLGYLVGDADLLSQFAKTRTLLDINCFAIEIAKILLAEDKIMRSHVDHVLEAKAVIAKLLQGRDVEFINTHTNFTFVRPPRDIDIDLLTVFLYERGYLVRSMRDTHSVLDGCIRFTLGSAEQVATFTEALFDGFEYGKKVRLAELS